jgi:peptide chain release factor 1
MNSCRLTHIPTGLVRTAQTRNRQSSYRDAMLSLTHELDKLYSTNRRMVFDTIRKDQMGSGMRGDKIRTYRFQDDRVEDHQTNKRAQIKKVLSGNFDLLWN